jgi:hypothetical protein
MLARTHSTPQSSERLAVRRRQARRRTAVALGVIIFLSALGVVYGLRQSGVRIASVDVVGADQSLSKVASEAMQGNYFGIIPRDSIFFFPGGRIRSALMEAQPDIGAVSMFRTGLTGLSIRISDRVPIARWCGLSPTPDIDEYCYAFDASGFIYAPLATGTPTINNFTVYAPLVGDTLEPLRSTLLNFDKLPSAFDFARKLDTFGSPVASIVFRSDEVDEYLSSGTRLTYVLGDEQSAFTALVSAKDSIDLADSSLEYVDLRFDGKVYVKKKQSQK